MSDKQIPAGQIPAELVIEELGNVHGGTIVRLSAEIAHLRAKVAQQAEELAYLRSTQVPA